MTANSGGSTVSLVNTEPMTFSTMPLTTECSYGVSSATGSRRGRKASSLKKIGTMFGWKRIQFDRKYLILQGLPIAPPQRSLCHHCRADALRNEECYIGKTSLDEPHPGRRLSLPTDTGKAPAPIMMKSGLGDRQCKGMDGAATYPLRLVCKWIQSLTKPTSIPQSETLALRSPPPGIIVPDSLSMSPIVDIEPIAYGWDREFEHQTNGNADMSSRAGCLGMEEYFCWRADGGSSSGAMSSSRRVPSMHLGCSHPLGLLAGIRAWSLGWIRKDCQGRGDLRALYTLATFVVYENTLEQAYKRSDKLTISSAAITGINLPSVHGNQDF
ncbi:hypothetical protein B0J13DRAFT_534136 [Dactylonectria estremocensis]|uniref:Uncharacterized protein n=1 Tax=Dactylonectria estremocensis TaxID=1079267 RepID=A0A9P9D426_9HYPO|nr:hypothetical protein B0J13DRAFT_534136 [Dactylonectria estremocensis]